MTNLRKALSLGSVLCVLGVGIPVGAKTIAQFNFDSSPDGGITFSDISGNGHDAVYNKPVALQDSDPFDDKGAESKDKSVVEAVQSKSSVTAASLNNADKIDFAATNDFTIAVWVNPSQYPKGKALARVIQLESKAGGTTNIFMGIDSQGKALARVYSKGAGSHAFGKKTEVPLNKWTHLALVYDGGTATLYVNGKEDVTQHVGRSLPKSLKRAAIGSHFTGAIDDVLISDDALPADQLGLKKSFTGQGKAAAKSADEKK